MGVILNFFAVVIASVSLNLVDPQDCMTQSDAEMLKTMLESEPYILDYCDCCSNYQGKVIKISSLRVVPCEYDKSRFSVKVIGTTVNNDDDTTPYQGLATLNYSFYYYAGSAFRLGHLVDLNYEGPDCQGANFPNMENRDYMKWKRSKE